MASMEINSEFLDLSVGASQSGDLAFAVDDMGGFITQLAAKGYALSDGPMRTGSGSLIAFIDAPEGYEIELIQKPH